METKSFLEKIKSFPKKGNLYINKKDISISTTEGYEIRCKKPEEFTIDECCLDMSLFIKSLNCFETSVSLLQDEDKITFKHGSTRLKQSLLSYNKPTRLKQKNIKELPSNIKEACKVCIDSTIYKTSTNNNLFVHIKDNTLYFTDNIVCVRFKLDKDIDDCILPFSFIKHISNNDFTHLNVGKTCTSFMNKEHCYTCPVYCGEPTSFDFIFESKDKRVQIPECTKYVLKKIHTFMDNDSNILSLKLKDCTYTIQYCKGNIVSFEEKYAVDPNNFDYNLDINVNGLYLHNAINVMDEICMINYANNVIYFEKDNIDIAISVME